MITNQGQRGKLYRNQETDETYVGICLMARQNKDALGLNTELSELLADTLVTP